MTDMNPILRIFPDSATLFFAASEQIAASLEKKLQEKQDVTLVLTGGKTPKPVYELLASDPYRTRLDWKRVHFFWGDERCVAPDNPESNFGMARDALLTKIETPGENVHRIQGELDAGKAADMYEQEIRRILPPPGVPAFDLVLMGMGADGHTASLFPGTQWVEERLVVANHVPETGAKRVSMTPRILNASGEVIFLVSGQGKAEALACVLERPGCDLPATRIRPDRGTLLWMVDRPAASLLRNPKRT